MNLEEINQDSTEMFNLDEIDNNLKLGENTTNIEKKNCGCKKSKCKFVSKFPVVLKLVFWVGMLILTIILGYTSFKEAIKISGAISDRLEGADAKGAFENMSTGFMIFESIFLWIEALFYVIIFSWSIYGTTKNSIIIGKKRKAKKNIKKAKEEANGDSATKSKKELKKENKKEAKKIAKEDKKEEKD